MLQQRHVVQHPEGGWAVVKPHADRISSRHETQADAQARAKDILARAGGGEAVTHSRNGSIRQSDTVQPTTVDWSLLSPQGHVLLYIALCPDSTATDVARAMGRTRRQVWTIIKGLKQRGMLTIRKKDRKHFFRINFDAQFLHPTIDELTLNSVLKEAVEQVQADNPDVCEEIRATASA